MGTEQGRRVIQVGMDWESGHGRKSVTVEDWKLSKTGHGTITVRQDSGERFKTLARNVEQVG